MQKYTYKMVNGKLRPVNIGARPFAEFKIGEGYARQYNKFQERLLVYLKANGLSQAEFTRLMQKAAWREGLTKNNDWVSFSYSTVSKWCSGKFCAEPQRRALICKYCGISDEWLVGRVPLGSTRYKDKRALLFSLDNENTPAA